MATITGSNGNDDLAGTTADDVFRPLLGNDTVFGNGGVDTLIVDYSGNSQFDTSSEFQVSPLGHQGYFIGSYPADRVQFYDVDRIEWTGGSRNDGLAITYFVPMPLAGEPPAQPLALGSALRFDGGPGANGASLVFTNYAFAVSFTASGNVVGDYGTFVNFGQFNVYGTAFADSLTGGAGNDILSSDAGNDTLAGGDGNDFLIPGDGVDSVSGGAGDDHFQVLSISAGDVFDGGSGIDSLEVDFGTATGPTFLDLSALAGGGSVVIAGATFSSFERLANYAGGAFADTLVLGPSITDDTQIRVYGGDDNITGGSGRDFIIAYDGNDTIDGGANNDRLFGDEGNDLLRGGSGDDEVYGRQDNDVLEGNDGDDVVGGDEGNDTLSGGIGNDQLLGGAGGDRLEGGEGNDSLYAGASFLGGNGSEAGNFLSGGAGNDVLVGGWGDTLDGGIGTDAVLLDLSNASAGITLSLVDLVGGGTVALGSGYVTGIEGYIGILATPFDDDITIGSVQPGFGVFYGIDGVQAYDGNDRVTGGAGNDQLFGGNGNDTLIGLAGSDYLAGGDGDDSLTAGDGDDNIAAGGGNDAIDAGAGNDGINGDAGNDTILAGEGVNGVQGGDGDDLIASGGGADTIGGGDGADSIDSGAGSDQVNAGAGNDVVSTGDGNDTLDGGAGDDLLAGGAGNDSYFVESMADLTFEAVGGGIDTVTSIGSIYLYANIENLALSSFGTASFGVGNELANVITGNFGDNLLLGGAGNDTVNAGGGNDAVFGETGADSIDGAAGIDYLVGGDGNDTIDGGDQPDALYGEAGDDLLVGGFNFHTDILVGGDGNDTLDGASGLGDYDLLNGAAGDDIYRVDTPADLTFEAAGEGDDTVIADIRGAGYYLYPHVENLTLAGITPFGVGNDLANRLTGSDADNWLLGGAGDDTLDGAGGVDVVFGQDGADRFVFRRGGAGDVIGDFTVGVDKLQLLGVGITSFAQVQRNAVEVSGNTAIDLGDGELVVLLGVAKSQLAAGDFLFG